MKASFIIPGLIASLLITGCASEQPLSITPQKEDSRSQEGKEEGETSNNRMICKYRPITGSRFKQKTCMTEEEWETMSRRSQETLNKQRQRGAQGNPDG
ncbi:hypothetical protein ACJJI4_00925 [Microbulbifer sp. TRSA002]|uniref:hypothetical protein n=1 Tax=Microbulbifer sp. TRSA002 TaxID=3243382 RepID=UPI00403A4E1E